MTNSIPEKSFGKNRQKMKVKCSECLEEKKLSEIQNREYRYICNECLEKVNSD